MSARGTSRHSAACRRLEQKRTCRDGGDVANDPRADIGFAKAAVRCPFSTAVRRSTMRRHPGGWHETTRVHHACCWRVRHMAASRVCAADHQMRRVGVLSGGPADDPEIKARFAALATIGLDRRPQSAGRIPLGRGQCRQHSQICSGVGRPCTRCHPGQWRPGHRAVAAGRPEPRRSCS
jgi:hypothetical protein